MATGSPYWNVVQDLQGNALVGVMVAVLPFGADLSTQPGSPLSLIYSDAALTVPLANPMRTDSFGRFQFYALPGFYLLQIFGSGPSFANILPTYVVPIVLASPTGGGGGFTWTIKNKSANYSAVANDLVRCDTSGGGFTVTLPLSSSNAGLMITVKKVSSDGNTLTVARSGSDVIDGLTSQLITVSGDSMTVVADGAGHWDII